MPSCFVGVDLGTTATKVVAFDAQNRVVAQASRDYPLEAPEPGVAKQDPELVVRAAGDALREVVAAVGASGVTALGFSGAMHGVLPLDARDRPLTHVLTWADGRAAPWAEQIRLRENGLAVSLRSGTPLYAMSPLAKLRWLHQERPEIAQKAARFVSIKEYLLHAWFGAWAIDESLASATGLYNLGTRDWDPEALELARVKAGQLSPLVPTTQRLPDWRPEVARDLGLDPTTPACAGAGDGACANLGSGALTPDVVAVSLGTSGAVRVTLPRPWMDSGGRSFCYVLTEGLWVAGAPVSNGAVVLRWLRDRFAPLDAAAARARGQDPYDAVLQLAAGVPAGSAGLLCLPYLLGERAPLWSADARGAFVGATLGHRREHFVRAALEGVCLNLASALQLLGGAVGAAPSFRASGGFARSGLWRQMLCDVLGGPLSVPGTAETSCLGAALLARRALGELPNLAALPFAASAQHTPDAAAHAVYTELLPIFGRLGAAMLPEMRALAAFQHEHGVPS